MTKSSDKSPQAPEASDRPPAKKPYSKPRLETYGDLRKITNHVGVHGRTDGVIPFIRTHA